MPSSRPRSWRPAGRSAASARRASSCAPPATRRRRSTRRWPRTSAGARAGARCTRRSKAGRRTRARLRGAASARAALEGGPQHVAAIVPLGGGGFADDTAPRDALVAVPWPPGSMQWVVEAPARWVVARRSQRARAGKVQGRRTTVDDAPPLALPACPKAACGSRRRGSSPRTSNPTRRGACPAANPRRRSRTAARSAARSTQPSPAAARELARSATANRCGSCSRAKTSCGSGPKRPPISRDRGRARRRGRDRGRRRAARNDERLADRRRSAGRGRRGPKPTSRARRSEPSCGPRAWPNRRCSSAGALGARRRRCVTPTRAAVASARASRSNADDAAPLDGRRSGLGSRRSARRGRAAVVRDRRGAHGAGLGAHRVDRGRSRDGRGARPHDPVVRHHPRPRHAAGARHDAPDDAPPRARASDAVFAAVAAATWNALTRAEGVRPDTFPARETRTARLLRR